jgi:hypothetical protein
MAWSRTYWLADVVGGSLLGIEISLTVFASVRGWQRPGAQTSAMGLGNPVYVPAGGGLVAALCPFERRINQTTPKTTQARARIPKAIQPHCVLLVSDSSWLAAAAPAAATAPGRTIATADVSDTVVVSVCAMVTVSAGTILWIVSPGSVSVSVSAGAVTVTGPVSAEAGLVSVATASKLAALPE